MTEAEDDEVVSQYLQALEAARAAPGGFLDPDQAAPALAGAEMVAGDDQEQLQAQLAESVPGSAGHVRKLEDEFVRVAARYSARHGTTYDAWRKAGVDTSVLARAQIDRPAG